MIRLITNIKYKNSFTVKILNFANVLNYFSFIFCSFIFILVIFFAILVVFFIYTCLI